MDEWKVKAMGSVVISKHKQKIKISSQLLVVSVKGIRVKVDLVKS